MSFKSIDELGRFSFEDVVIEDMRFVNGEVHFTLNALIVLPNNSQNTNYTMSYADTSELVLEAGKMVEAVREGFKYYDADDNLIEAVPEKPFLAPELDSVPEKCLGGYLCEVQKVYLDDEPVRNTVGTEAEATKQLYDFYIEFPADDGTNGVAPESFRLRFSFEHAVVCWERYLNRVQQ